jgi:hypothetical protein
MKIKALWSFKTLGNTKQAIQYYIPEDLNNLKHHCASIKSCNPSKLCIQELTFPKLLSFTLNTKNFMNTVSHSSVTSDNGSRISLAAS